MYHPIKQLKKKGTKFHVAYVPNVEIEARTHLLDTYLKPTAYTPEELKGLYDEEVENHDSLGLVCFS